MRTGGLFTQRPSGAHRPRAPCTGAALLRPPSYAPRDHEHTDWMRARCPRSQARSQAALPAGEMPALPGVLPGGVSCGQDACAPRRAPRRRCLRARCPRSQACSQAALPAGKMPALPGGAACGRDARAPRPSVALRLPDSVALFRRAAQRRWAVRAHRCRRPGCDARDSPHRQSQRRA